MRNQIRKEYAPVPIIPPVQVVLSGAVKTLTPTSFFKTHSVILAETK